MGTLVVSAEMGERRIQVAEERLHALGLTPAQRVAVRRLMVEVSRFAFVQGGVHGGLSAVEAAEHFDSSVAS